MIQVDGLNILTDPIWSERASPVTFSGPKRIRPPGVAIEDLPEIDLIVVSHNHYDHMDTASLRALRERQSREPVIVSGLGNAGLLRSLGYDNAIELDWDESTNVGSSKVHFVECQHQSARGLHDRMRTLGAPSLSRPVKAPSISLEIRDTRHTLQTKVSDMDPSHLASFRSAPMSRVIL